MIEDMSACTNSELLERYENVTTIDELDPLMGEMMNRLEWYIYNYDVPQGDTSKETYERFTD